MKVKKEQLKENFEGCFEVKLEDILTEGDLKKYWSDNTSVEKAVSMLDTAAFNLAVAAMKGDVVGAIIMMCEAMGDAEEEMEAARENEELDQFQVFNTEGRYFYDDVFTSVDDAKAFINEKALNTQFKVADFKVVRVYD